MPSTPTPTEKLRAKQFKNSGRHEEMRRRRAEGSVELRKQKKDDQLMKRRNIDLRGMEEDGLSQGSGGDDQLSPTIQNFSPDECLGVLSGGEGAGEEYKRMLVKLRKVLSKSQTPPVDMVIRAGLVPHLIKALFSQESTIQFEAAWALTNIVSGTSEQTGVVVEGGGVGGLTALLSSPHLHVAEQAAWALGNIAGESAQYRDLVISAGAVGAMVTLVQTRQISVEFLRTLAWTFSNFCRHRRPQVDTEKIQDIIPLIAWMVQHEDREVKTDACWALSYFTDGPDDRIGLALRAGVLPVMIELLGHENKKLAAPALRTLGNIVTGSDQMTQVVVESGVLARICALFPQLSSHPGLSREACWMLSNVVAGTREQIQAVIDANLFPYIVELLDKFVTICSPCEVYYALAQKRLFEGDFRTQTEAAWAVTNVGTGGSPEQIHHLLAAGALPPFVKLLTCKDPKIVLVVLDGIRQFLDVSEQLDKQEELALSLEELGALDAMEALQEHQNEDIYKKVVHMIEKYFGTDSDEDEDNKENALPENYENPEVPKKGFEF